jgi:UPF0755 protein
LSQTGPGSGDDPAVDPRVDPQLDPDDAFDDRRDDDELFEGVSHDEPEPHRSRRRRGCGPVLIVLAIVLLVVFLAGRWAFGEISSRLAPPPDYAGPGKGSVLYEVKQGASSTVIGRELKKAQVVKSVDAFNDAAARDERSRTIQVGYYQLKKKMKASQALAVLVDPKNLMQNTVVVPEGARVRDIVKTIVSKTDIGNRAVTEALANPKAIGLPAEANGNPEGYLFPATYTVPPKQDALGLITQMVTKSVEAEQSLGIESKAKALGLTPEEVLTVASILEYEANKPEDYPRVARVLYNRMKKDMPLQLDSTVSYVSKRSGDVWTTSAERSNTSLYNTYKHTGLPPGPIGSPGKETIEAALNPADGDWLYFVPDYADNTTRFSSTYAEHQKWVAKLKKYCRSSDDC